ISPVRDGQGRIFAASKVARDITARRQAEEAVRRQNERLLMLNEAAGHLLSVDDPHAMVRGLFERVRDHLGVDAYFNYVVSEAEDALVLASCAGVPEEAARSVARLDFGQAVSGAVALERRPITVTHIQTSDDPRVGLVKSLGFRAYTCNPLLAGSRLLG